MAIDAKATLKRINLRLLCRTAMDYIRDQPIGKEFRLRDLYREDEWEAMKVGDRIKLGVEIARLVQCGQLKGVEVVSSREIGNQAMYRRVPMRK